MIDCCTVIKSSDPPLISSYFASELSDFLVTSKVVLSNSSPGYSFLVQSLYLTVLKGFFIFILKPLKNVGIFLKTLFS